MVLIPEFEKASGNTVTMETGAAGRMVARIEKGEAVDVAIVTPAQIEKLVSQTKVVSGSQVNVAKVGMGLAASKTAATPDIHSLEGFKQALIAAKSIGHTDPAGGASSAIYAAKLLASLDIAPELKSKIRVYTSNEKLFEAVGKGDIELGFGQLTEIVATPQVVLVGPLPRPIQNYSIFAAGVAATAKDPDLAQAFVSFLSTPAAIALMKAKGIESP
jgi:molybdate transport system substrate-binding protein